MVGSNVVICSLITLRLPWFQLVFFPCSGNQDVAFRHCGGESTEQDLSQFLHQEQNFSQNASRKNPSRAVQLNRSTNP